MKKMLQVLLVVLIGVTVMFGGRWYTYVSNTASPYDEVGIALNGYAPAPLRAWGCAKLHATFPKNLPPHGCSQPGGAPGQWMQ
jgi:hypothetical protein